jgi:hypothetical protein
VASIAALLVVGVVSRFWLNIEAMVPMGLFYVPMAFLWLRRDLARNQG